MSFHLKSIQPVGGDNSAPFAITPLLSLCTCFGLLPEFDNGIRCSLLQFVMIWHWIQLKQGLGATRMMETERLAL